MQVERRARSRERNCGRREHIRCSFDIDAISAKSHLGRSAFENLNEDVAGRPHEAGSHTCPDLPDGLDDMSLTLHEMIERGIEIVHGHTEMVDSLHTFANRNMNSVCFFQRGDKQIDPTDAQVHSAGSTDNLGIEAASKPRGRRFRICGA